MAINKKLLPGKKVHHHHPIRIKKQAVKELETGKLTLQQVMNKYGLIDKRSVINWMRPYSELDESEYTQMPIPLNVRRTAAYQVEAGTLTINQAAKKYLVTAETVRNWEKRYSCNANNNAKPKEMSFTEIAIQWNYLRKRKVESWFL